MNFNKIILIILIFSQTAILCSQTVEFTYDGNGNRLTRTISTEQLKSESVQFPVYDPKSLIPEENMKGQVSDEGTITTLVYPNPNKGLIKVEIVNMPLETKNELRIYDLSGTQYIIKRNLESYTEVDVSRLKDGIYILRIKVNENIFNWKIIKKN